MSWIFAYGVGFNRKSQPYIFSAGLRFTFQLKRMQKNSGMHFVACCWTRSKRNLLFSWTMKSAKRRVAACFLHTFLFKNKAQTSGKKILWFSKKLETTCKNSAHLDKNKTKQKQTKIWHRMAMLQRLQFIVFWSIKKQESGCFTCNLTKKCIMHFFHRIEGKGMIINFTN